MKEKGVNDIIRIISVSSFIFAVLNSIFSIFGLESTNEYLFIWFIVNLFALYLLKKKNRWNTIAPIIMLLPMVFFRDVLQFIFLGITVSVAIFLLRGGLQNYRYSTVVEEFRQNLFVLAVIYGFSLLGDAIGVEAMSLFGNYVAPYIFIYLITSIILLRTLRYMENMGGADKINKINFRSALAIIIISIGMSNQWVWGILRNILATIKDIYDRIIIFIFSWIFVPVGYIMDFLFNLFFKLFRERKGDGEQTPMDGELDLSGVDTPTISPEAAEKINQFILNVLLVISIIAFLYLIFRIYSKNAKKDIVAEDYTESKEFIFKERKKEEGFFKRLSNFIKPKSNEDKIRIYYKKFLENCKEQHIEILGSDTSQDISEKARYVFDPIIMEKMRKIYIRVRYGQQKIDGNTYEEFKGYYKELNKIAKNR